MVKIQTDNECWFIAYLTAENQTSYIISLDTLKHIDDYTFFKLSERKYIPHMHYTINIQKLWKD